MPICPNFAIGFGKENRPTAKPANQDDYVKATLWTEVFRDSRHILKGVYNRRRLRKALQTYNHNLCCIKEYKKIQKKPLTSSVFKFEAL